MTKRLIVTHHAPDCDAIGSSWILKRFDAQHYATAQHAFVDPGATIDPSEAERLGFQMHEVTHVDTGLGEFDHHQPDRGLLRICATSLVYDYVCRIHPELKSDVALQAVVAFVTDDDHFGEVNWPEPDNLRYSFMLSSLLHGFESVDPHDDDSQMAFGLKCFDCAYAALKENIQARDIIAEAGQPFEIDGLKCLAVETKNDSVMKYAQKTGFALVIRKDPSSGEVRVKARPDTSVDLKPLAELITQLDPNGTWYYHPSGKMLLNGSKKHRHQRPTKLSLQEVVEAAKTALSRT
ncbi:hypothetical protein H3C70_02665 [Patescibacteria group bacterium]|nr:hypothetical protein [Patescibacteria group bacterium]